MTTSSSVLIRKSALGRESGRVLPAPVSGQEFVLVGVIVVLWIALGIASPEFLSPSSVRTFLSNVAPVGIMGVGMTIVMISGGIDLSVSGILMVCAVIAAKAMVVLSTPFWLTITIAVSIGAILGLINGMLIAVGRVHALIITFGTWNVFLFIGYRIFDSQFVNGIPPTISILGSGSSSALVGVPVSFILMALILAAAWWYMRYTAGGRHYYAIGSDNAAARLVGIKVNQRIVSAYVVSGLLVGLGACITIANGTESLPPTVGTGTELAVIAAVVIGGTSIMGGSGSVFGTLLGAILVQTVASGVTMLLLPSQLSMLFIGVFIIIAVGADLLRQRIRRRA